MARGTYPRKKRNAPDEARIAGDKTLVKATIPSRSLPGNTRTRLQPLLDEGDCLFFLNHPSETTRRRFYFRGEHVDDQGEPTRYIIVERDGNGRLLRRFEPNRGEA